jgi:hypothetical protein
MSSPGRHRRGAVLLALVLALTSCGSDGSDEASSEPTAPATSDSTAPASSSAVEATADAEEEEPEVQVAEETWADIFPEIALGPTEPGPRPTLSWSGVDGAALYQLSVLDADGVPYWGWSGTETAVPIGGMDNPDAIGAWVFEELTWMVVARDADGAPLGMSRRGLLEP